MDKGKAKEKTFEHEDFPGLSLPPPPSMMDDDGDEILSEPQVGSPSARANSYPTAQPSNSRSPASFLQPGNEEQSHSDTDDTDTERSRSTSGPTPTQMQQGMPRGGVKRRKRSEPTSPVVVVLYVVALYLIFQILTRSDEHEVLGHLHLPTTSSSFMQSQSPRSNIDVSQQQQPYHLPYQFPPIPNPMPSIPKDKEDGISFWRLLLGILMYPLYLVVTLLATPLPIILNLLHILKEVVEIVLLYPVISVVRAIFWTFVMGPWGVIKGILDIFYPVYVFVGGVVGVGCVMGLGAGWVGRMALDWVIAWKNGTTSGQSGGQRQRSKTAGGATQVQTGSRIGITGNNLSSKSARIDSYGDGGEKDDYDDICKEYQKISTATPSFVSKTISPNSITYLVSAPAVPKVGLSRVTQSTFNPFGPGGSGSSPTSGSTTSSSSARSKQPPVSALKQSRTHHHHQFQAQNQNRPQPIQTGSHSHSHSRSRSVSDEFQQIITPVGAPNEYTHDHVSLFDSADSDSRRRYNIGGGARKIPLEDEAGRATAREAPVVGIRKRGVREG